MQLVTLEVASKILHPGIVVDDEILDLVRCVDAMPEANLLPPSWRRILAAGDAGMVLVRRLYDQAKAGGTLAERLREQNALVKKESATLAAPIPDPALLLSCGTNYREHMQ